MSWRDIEGWGNFEEWHSLVMPFLKPGDTAVELGVAYGRGLGALATAASGKGIRVVGIDHFNGTTFEPPGKYIGISRDSAIERLTRAGIPPDAYEIIVSDTAKAAALFDKVQYVFIDADHSHAGICRDLDAWIPKVTGFIGGDDWDSAEVQQAVRDRLTGIESCGRCWIAQITPHLMATK